MYATIYVFILQYIINIIYIYNEYIYVCLFICSYPRPRNRLGSVEVRNCCAVLWAKRAKWRAHNLSSWR